MIKAPEMYLIAIENYNLNAFQGKGHFESHVTFSTVMQRFPVLSTQLKLQQS